MTATDSFIIPAAHPRSHVGSSGNSRARPLRSPPDVRHSFLLGSDFHPVPGSVFAIPSRVRARRFPPVLDERQRSKAFLTSKTKNIMANFETRF